jgi:cytochrome c
MQLKSLIGIASLSLSLSFSANLFAADEAATADEVVEKVKAAAVELAGAGEAGIAAFQGKDSKWAWKDTYVFVYDCEADQALAHPTLTGKPVMHIKDKADKELFVELCAAGKQATGGWVSYMWPKPGAEEPSQKISYALAVDGTTYQVSAGIYSDDASVNELNAALK